MKLQTQQGPSVTALAYASITVDADWSALATFTASKNHSIRFRRKFLGTMSDALCKSHQARPAVIPCKLSMAAVDTIGPV